MKKQHKNRIVAFLLVSAMLFSSVGCSYAILSCTAYSCASCTPDEVKEQVADTIKEEIANNIPQIGDLFESDSEPKEATAEFTKAEGTPAANEAFLALDREIFTWYVTSDIVTLDQYCYDPASFGIDASAVPVTLGEFTEQSQSAWIRECENWLNRLQKLDAEHLSDQNRFAYDNYIRYFENEIAYDGLFYYYEPLEEYVGLHVNLPLTFGLYEFRDETDITNYLALLADVPRYFAQVLAFEQKRAELGIFMTETMLDSVLADLDQVIASRETNYLYSTFRDSIGEIDWLDGAGKMSYIEQNDALISGAYTDAYATLRTGMEALRPYCREMIGAKNMDTKALRYFALELKTQSGCDLTVEEALTFLDNAAMDLYYPLWAAVRKSSGKEMDITTGTVAGDERYLKTLITDIVPTMPQVSVQYKDIPPELQESFSPAAYLIPAVDHASENTILINPAAETDLLTLAHEGYPGHMYQYTYHQSLGTIPLFQMVMEPIGYAEGWANSAEYSVAKRADMFGAADCISEVLNKNLTSLIVTVASLMVNGRGASQKEMTEFLKEWAMESYSDYIYEIAVNRPIYYFKYVMGFCLQYEITENCRETFDFADKDFYREYLSWGPGYYDLLEKKMNAWAEFQAETR